MTKRCYLKRIIEVGEQLTFDDGRLYLKLVARSSGVQATFELRQEDGAVSRRTLHVGERLVLDGGNIVVELDRRSGRRARMFMDLAQHIALNPPKTADEPASEADGTPPFGGYL